MSKNLEKSAANLERIAQEKIRTIRRVVLSDGRREGVQMRGTGIRLREIETVVFESLQVRKALKRLRRTQKRRLRKAETGK